MLDRTIAPDYKTINTYSLPEVQRTKLDNGVSYFYYEGGLQEICRLDLVFHAGIMFEKKNGQAHLTAKMLTEGTKNFSAIEIHESLAQYGAFIEVQPATENVTISVYVLSRFLEKILPVLNDIVCVPVFPQEEIDSQKNILIQQLKVSKEKTSYLASVAFKEDVFDGNHPYGKSLKESDIEALERKDLIDFFEAHYSLGRCQLFYSGNGLPNHQKIINSWFGKKEELKDVLPFAVYNFAGFEAGKPSRRHIEKEGSLQSSIRIGKTTMPIVNADFFEFSFLSEIYGGYFGSRLMQNIREDKGYTYGIRSNVYQLKYQNYFMVYADVKKEFVQESIQQIFVEMEKLQNDLVSDHELDNVRNYLLGQFISTINTPFAIMDRFKFIHFMDLDYRYYQQAFDSIKQLKASDIKTSAMKYFMQDSFTVVSVG